MDEPEGVEAAGGEEKEEEFMDENWTIKRLVRGNLDIVPSQMVRFCWFLIDVLAEAISRPCDAYIILISTSKSSTHTTR